MSQGEKTCQITVICACAHFDIGKPANVVFTFQLYVHHIFFVEVQLFTQQFTLSAIFVIDLDFLDGITGKVLQQQVLSAPEEVLAVEQQVLHEPTVVIDASAVFQFHPGQLLYQSVKHRAFS